MKKIKCIVACCALLLIAWNVNAQPNISRIEYYIDSDPGFGKGAAVTFTAGTNIANKTFNIDPASLSTGFHILGIRAKNANGAWSFDNKWFFIKPSSPPAGTPGLKHVEYYIDKDPGYGKATKVTFSPTTNLSNVAINIDPSTLTAGFHIFGIRASDSTGKWSLDNKWFFIKPSSPPAGTPGLKHVEYYIDKDPGYGKATKVTFSPTANLVNIPINIDPATLSTGVHILGIRSSDSTGKWSLDNKWLFVKPISAPSTATDTLSLVEYYIDNDPGFGKGLPIATNSVTNLSNINLSINISGLAAGDHHLFIRSKTKKNVWSLDNKLDFKVTSPVASPSIVITSLSKKTLCAPDTLKIGYQKSGTFNSGNIFKVQLSNSTGSFSSPVQIGSFTGTGSTVVTCIIPQGTAAGNRYRVRVVSTNPVVTGVKSSDSLNITNCANSSIALMAPVSVRYSSANITEYEQTGVLDVYPNPARSSVYLQFTSPNSNDYVVELSDITGKLLLRREGKSLKGVNLLNFNISKYQNGMYLLKLKSKKEPMKSVMFTKQG